ncbi:hypothetical protein AB835_14895 [Candidatus Endobugula sertula]|uniref:Immunity MXAN-0049 protein domain-containing protein n=1 Tax=Candidatus Endobugula sertula TaxID=62101 RepID=A0A1D2QL59_9GAMM|nr:hypothetical protein AB835_14895 [Candidatus Endobugula sertula]
MVTTDIRKALLDLDISDFFTHPAVYIHADDEWYEDYWFCTFTEEFDCWDRDKSDYRAQSERSVVRHKELGLVGENHFIFKYRLNEHLLDETPLNETLFFKMGGGSGKVTCNKSIKHLFENEGTQLTLVEEW